MARNRAAAGNSLLALFALTGGAAALGVSMAPSISARAQLDAAVNATYNASSYSTTASTNPSERDIVNAPNRYEEIANGEVSQIWVGNTIYRTIPASCHTKVAFIESHPQGFGTSRFSGFGGDMVTQNDDFFSVRKYGHLIADFVVKDGFMVQDRQFFNGDTSDFVVDFDEINHAPRITVPSQSEVTRNPKIFEGDCPL
jgi:hypothetical protein